MSESSEQPQPSTWKTELVDQGVMIGGSALAGAGMAMVDNMITHSAASSSTTGWSTAMLSYLASSAMREKSETDKPTHWGIKSLFGTYWKMNAAMATYRLTQTAMSIFPDAMIPSMVKEVGSATFVNMISGGEVAHMLYTGLIATNPLWALATTGLAMAIGTVGMGSVGLAAVAASEELQSLLAQMIFGETIGLITRAITDPGVKRFPPGTLITRTGKESYAEASVNQMESAVLYGNKLYKSITPTIVQKITSGFLEGLDLIGNKMPGRFLSSITNTVLDYFQPKNPQKSAVGYLHALSSLQGSEIPQQPIMTDYLSKHLDSFLSEEGGYTKLVDANRNVDMRNIDTYAELMKKVYWRAMNEFDKQHNIGERDAVKNPTYGMLSQSMKLELIRLVSMKHEEYKNGYIDYAKSLLWGKPPEDTVAVPASFKIKYDTTKPTQTAALGSSQYAQLPAASRMHDSYSAQLTPPPSGKIEQIEPAPIQEQHTFNLPASEPVFLHQLRNSALTSALSTSPAVKTMWVEPQPEYQFDPDGYTTRNPSLPPLSALDFANWVKHDKGMSTIQSVLVYDDARALPLAKQLGMEVLTVPTVNARLQYHIQVRPRDTIKWSDENSLQKQLSEGNQVAIPAAADQGKSNIERLREELAKPPAPQQQGMTRYLHEKAATLAINAAYSVMKPVAMEMTAMGAGIAIDWSRKKLKTSLFGSGPFKPVTDHPKHQLAALSLNEVQKISSSTQTSSVEERIVQYFSAYKRIDDYFAPYLAKQPKPMKVYTEEKLAEKKAKKEQEYQQNIEKYIDLLVEDLGPKFSHYTKSELYEFLKAESTSYDSVTTFIKKYRLL